ncbi:MAG: PEP/pyruvate-binding domain-containing protein, partial [Nanoarchaeota archaeon]
MVIKKRVEDISASGKYVKWLSELSKTSGGVAGGKGANLAEMYNSGFPVPPAFCVTAQAFDAYLEAAGLKAQIKKIISETDIDNTKELDENAKKIREIIINSSMPEDMVEEITEAYELLSTDQEVKKAQLNVSKSAMDILRNSHEPVFVAVRSSATTEDLAAASFAGQQETYTNIKGNKELILAIKKCFASLYTARAVYYRKKKGFKESEALLSAVIQRMVNSDKSGVAFTKNPVSGANEMIVEAVFGLGEGIVSGKIKPDHYVVNPDLEIIEKKIADKKVAIVRQANGEEKTVTLTPEKSKQQVMTDAEIKSLAYTAQKIEEHYKKAQDIEFAVETGRIFIVQTRPVTTIEKSSAVKKQVLSGNVLLSGMPASPGVAFGPVKLVHTLEDLEKIVKGDILVTKMTNPDMVVAMQRCSAIITDEGGATAHAAIVSREMGIPCFSGDTIIMTDKGFMNLVDANNRILNGEIIHTLSFDIQKLKTEWKQILNTSKRQSPTITISASKNGQVEWNTLTTTPEHKFFSFESRVPCYKKINEILANESIIYSANKMPILPQILTINPQKAYTCGAIFSDGYLRIKKGGGGSTVFAQKSTPQKMEFINEVCKNFENVYDYKLRWVRPSYYYCYSKKITEDLLNIYDNINKIILGLDEYSIIKYLASIIDGDGNFIERGKVIKISIDAKDVNLLQSLVLSCMRLGLNYRIRKEDNQFRFYITSGIEKLKPYLKRVIVTNYEKTTGDTYFSAKHLFLDIPICGRKG